MNNKLRTEIIELALQRGVTKTVRVICGKEVSDYEGTANVELNGQQYNVTGRKSKQHGALYTDGYCAIRNKQLYKGLLSNFNPAHRFGG